MRISYDGQTITNMPLSQVRTQKTAKADNGEVRYCLILFPADGISCEWYDSLPDPASTVPEGIGYNILNVSASGVFMEAADCPDQICVHHMPIRGGGENIICLPHKLVVEITGKADMETPDAIAKARKAGQMTGAEGRYGSEANG